MANRFSSSSLSCLFGLPLIVGSLAFGASCTFDPPGSVLEKGNGGTPDAGGGGGGGGPDASLPVGPAETMTIGFTTTPRGIGPYTPSNIVAAWIEAADGTFISTIHRHSDLRTPSLKGWNAKVPLTPMDIDGLSGATRANHNTPISATWDIAAAAVADGDYVVRVETCEVNANSPDDNAQASFTFTKNGTAVSLTPTEANYENVTLEYSGR